MLASETIAGFSHRRQQDRYDLRRHLGGEHDLDREPPQASDPKLAIRRGRNLAARVAELTSFVDANEAPVFIQQIGTESSVDPYYSLLDAALTAVEAPSAKLAGYTSWEKVSVFSGSYGEGHLPTQDADPITRLYKSTRRAVFTAHFQTQ